MQQYKNLTELRNYFYDTMPSSGEITAWDMITWAKGMFLDFDKYIDMQRSPAKAEQEGPKWVKASSELPKNPGDPLNFYKLNGFKVNGNFYEEEEELVFGVIHHDGDYVVRNKDWDRLEWLDESTTPTVKEPNDIKEVTGFDTMAEYQAYTKGREDEQSVFLKFIEEWDGATNSAAGALLAGKLRPAPSGLRWIDNGLPEFTWRGPVITQRPDNTTGLKLATFTEHGWVIEDRFNNEWVIKWLSDSPAPVQVDPLSFHKWIKKEGWEPHSSGDYWYKLDYPSQWPTPHTCLEHELITLYTQSLQPKL
jgi:hypothetical protein